MFLRYMNTNRSVNLNNFDYIEVKFESGSWSDKDKYHVIAAKVLATIDTSLHPTIGGSYVSSDGIAEYIIKSFLNKEEADTFYESLQYAWINKLEIFEVN